MVRIEKSFFSKLIEKSETNKYNRKKWLSLCKTFLFAFIFFFKWLFLEILQKFWNFLNFQIFFDLVSFSSVQGHRKNSFLKKTITHVPTKNYWKWPKFLSNFSIFDRISNFSAKIFFTDSPSQDLPLCKKSGSYIENLIFYRFLLILVENGQFWLTPLTLGPLSWPPYKSDLSRKNFIGSEKDR